VSSKQKDRRVEKPVDKSEKNEQIFPMYILMSFDFPFVRLLGVQ
jgi:hypothetical protein